MNTIEARGIIATLDRCIECSERIMEEFKQNPPDNTAGLPPYPEALEVLQHELQGMREALAKDALKMYSWK